ncbi:DDE_3 domain-containing protein [Trichonephila clavipes]|nr:DDE_3 domain-containing protein [Trichonephila clavipes]
MTYLSDFQRPNHRSPSSWSKCVTEASQLLDVSTGRAQVWRTRVQAYDQDRFLLTVKHGGGSVMIYTAVSRFSAGPIVTLKGRITGEKNREILADHPMLQALFPKEDRIF